MPNWCQNTLTITGDATAVQNFIDANREATSDDKPGSPLSFEAYLPTPAALLAPGQDGWYDWRVSNWGTKWNADVTDDWLCVELPEADATLTEASLRFDTAWSPPVAWFETIAAQHPDLTLRLDYTEHGVGYTGYAIAEEGYFADHDLPYEGPDDDAYF